MLTAGATKYAITDAVPDHLKRVAVVELAAGDPVPADIVQLDLAYYASPALIPVNILALAAHAYTITSTIPAFLKKVCAVVLALLPIEITDGKSLKFNDKTNSMHLITAGV